MGHLGCEAGRNRCICRQSAPHGASRRQMRVLPVRQRGVNGLPVGLQLAARPKRVVAARPASAGLVPQLGSSRQQRRRSLLRYSPLTSSSRPPGSSSTSSSSSMLQLMDAWSQLADKLAPVPPTSTAAATDLILTALKLAVSCLQAAPPRPDGRTPLQRALDLAARLAELCAAGVPFDAHCIAAGVLAEAVDLRLCSVPLLEARLGPGVAALCHDILAVRHAPERLAGLDDASASALRDWLLSAFDVRAAAVEVVWRWCGAGGQGALPLYQQQLLALEGVLVWAPLGHALGLGPLAAQLEDTAFKVVFPSSYCATADWLQQLSATAAGALERCRVQLAAAAASDPSFTSLAAGVTLLGRTKSTYSTMKKLLRLEKLSAGGRGREEVYDLLGLRALVVPRVDLPPGEAEAAAAAACYRLRELAQGLWQPLPFRDKDYIAAPKPNGYQSLHTTFELPADLWAPRHQQQEDAVPTATAAAGGGGLAAPQQLQVHLELQVRTQAMHAAAERGAAAHAGYKGRLEGRQVRALAGWTAAWQARRRLLEQQAAAPQQQLQLPAPGAGGGGSSEEMAVAAADVAVVAASVSAAYAAVSGARSSSSVVLGQLPATPAPDAAAAAAVAAVPSPEDTAATTTAVGAVSSRSSCSGLEAHAVTAAAVATIAASISSAVGVVGEVEEMLLSLSEDSLVGSSSTTPSGSATSSRDEGELQRDGSTSSSSSSSGGVLSQEQLVAAAAALFAHLDLDGDGTLSLSELAVLLEELGGSATPEAAGRAGPFPSTAASSSGSSSSSLGAVGVPASLSAAGELLLLLDTNGDGQVSLGEFLHYWQQAAAAARAGGELEVDRVPSSSSSTVSDDSSSSSSSRSVGALLPGSSSSSSSSRGWQAHGCSPHGAVLLAAHQAVGRWRLAPGGSSSRRQRRGLTTASSSSSGSSSCCWHPASSWRLALPAAAGALVSGRGVGGVGSMQQQLALSRVACCSSAQDNPPSNSSSSSSSSSSSGSQQLGVEVVPSSEPLSTQLQETQPTTSSSSSSSSSRLEDQQQPQPQQQVSRVPSPARSQPPPLPQPRTRRPLMTSSLSSTPSSSRPDSPVGGSSSSPTDGVSSSSGGVGSSSGGIRTLGVPLVRPGGVAEGAGLDPPQQQQQQQQQQDISSSSYLLEHVDRSSSRSSSSSSGSMAFDCLSPMVLDGWPLADLRGVPPFQLVPLGDTSLLDMAGRELNQVPVPRLGPLVITNAPQQVWSADVVLDHRSETYERITLRLELVPPEPPQHEHEEEEEQEEDSSYWRGEPAAANGADPSSSSHLSGLRSYHNGSSSSRSEREGMQLQLRNLSRFVRGRASASCIQVNRRNVWPHAKGVLLQPGDTIWVPLLGAGFRVTAPGYPLGPPPAAAAGEGEGDEGHVSSYQGSPSAAVDAVAIAWAAHVAPLQQEATSGVREGVHVAARRALAALEQQQQQQQQVAAAGAGPSPSRWRPFGRDEEDSSSDEEAGRWDTPDITSSSSSAQGGRYSSGDAEMDAMDGLLLGLSGLIRDNPAVAEVVLSSCVARARHLPAPWFLWAQLAAAGGRISAARVLFRAAAACCQQLLLQLEDAHGPAAMTLDADSPVLQMSNRLVQVLRTWGRLEWEQRLFGSARRLWRLAANVAFRFPRQLGAGPGGSVLHNWGLAELERDNIRNARVVVSEGTRKCPGDAALLLLAGSIEAKAGSLQAARALFLRTFQLNRRNKHLYYYWPPVEAALGDVSRARALLSRGLALFPYNTKIMNVSATLEEQQGNVEGARALHRRALNIDSSSVTTMHNRVSWADLELRLGNVATARALLREGLDRHPNFAAALALMARLERLEGNLDLAEAYARRAQRASSAFAVLAMLELAQVYSARGERTLAANLKRHLNSVAARQAAKRDGAWGSTSWQLYGNRVSRSWEVRLAAAARQRKAELGLIRPPAGGQGQQQGGNGAWQQRQQQQWQQARAARQ